MDEADNPQVAASARREFRHLPPEAREAFLRAFSLLANTPEHATDELDVARLRDRNTGRFTQYWRLKVPGVEYRAVYVVRHGIAYVEAFRLRPGVYPWVEKVVGHRR